MARSERRRGRSTDRVVREMYDRLWSAYGPQHWWPARTPTEVVIGAILTQNTAWKNVEPAVKNLQSAHCLTWSALRHLSQDRLAELIQPSGTYRLKAARLKAFVDYLWDHHRGSLKSLLGGELDEARRRLLSIRGIGPETADAILLYAGERPTFVVDAYTKRILRRHFVIERNTNYETIRELFHDTMPQDVQLYNEYHALFVEVGKKHCQVRARCEACPLAKLRHDAAAR